ncbi:carbohydrate ABC transporter permease [Rathayibacter sp. CAU 1779]
MFLSPWFLGVAGVIAIPLGFSLYLSFTDYNFIGEAHWVGVQNYVRLFTQDTDYRQSLLVTLTYVVTASPLKLLVALLLALLLANPVKSGNSFYRAMFYLPSLIGTSAAIAIVWQKLFDVHGPFNGFLALLGIPPQAWASNPNTVVWVIVVLSIWQFGGPMVIFIAGLRQIPVETIEAAEMDGAGPWRRFWAITLPLLTPVLFFNLVVEIIGASQTFTSAQLIGDGNGGPLNRTLFYSLYLYQQAFQNQQVGYACAMAWVMFVILGVITALLFWSSRKWVFYGE